LRKGYAPLPTPVRVGISDYFIGFDLDKVVFWKYEPKMHNLKIWIDGSPVTELRGEDAGALFEWLSSHSRSPKLLLAADDTATANPA
jgi:hypothetical protein